MTGVERAMKKTIPALTDRRGPALFVRALLVALVPALGMPARAAERDQPAAWTPSLMMQVKRVGSVRISPDGRRVAFTVRQAVMEDNRSEYLTHVHLAGW